MIRIIYNFFDRLEDNIRRWFSKRPILYGFVGGVGVVLFWRGVWHTADMVMDTFFPMVVNGSAVDYTGGWPWWDGPLSILVGSMLLLLIGVFVSEFIGNEIVISGLKGDKKVADRTEEEVMQEAEDLQSIKTSLAGIYHKLEEIEERNGK